MAWRIKAVFRIMFSLLLLSCLTLIGTLGTYNVEVVLPIAVTLQAVTHVSSARPNRVDYIIWVRHRAFCIQQVVCVDFDYDDIREGLSAPALDQIVSNSILIIDHLLNRS